MSTIGKSWRDDAIVDTCSKDQVVTESVQLRDINLQTFTKDDIPFVAEFSLKMKRDDYVNVSQNLFNPLNPGVQTNKMSYKLIA